LIYYFNIVGRYKKEDGIKNSGDRSWKKGDRIKELEKRRSDLRIMKTEFRILKKRYSRC